MVKINILKVLTKRQSDIFVNDNEKYMRCLPVLDAPKSILIGYYESLVLMKKIAKLEDLPVNEKNGIWEMAKEFAAGRLSNNEQMIILSKCIYCLEYILNQ